MPQPSRLSVASAASAVSVASLPSPLATAQPVTAAPVGSARSAGSGGAAAAPVVSVDQVARWRRAADALLWLLIDELESAELVIGRELHTDPLASADLLAARAGALRSFQKAAARRLRSLVPKHAAPVSATARQDCDEVWQLRSELAVAAMNRDPNAIERFARLWVGVVQDAALRGRAGLFVR